MFQQRYHMVFKTSSNAELARKFSAYLQKKKSKLPVASIKAWIDARYQSQLIKDKAVDIEKQFNVVIGRETHSVIDTDELQKFAVTCEVSHSARLTLTHRLLFLFAQLGLIHGLGSTNQNIESSKNEIVGWISA